MRTCFTAILVILMLSLVQPVFAVDAGAAARELEQALHLQPNLRRGRRIYLLCAVCHMPEGWGFRDGSYPQIAGQHYSVIIKQLADIRARNRDVPIMLPFTMLENLTLQEIADVAAYVSRLPMTRDNGTGAGTHLVLGEELYRENCADCHGEAGEGIPGKQMPRIQGQHYRYLVRQFEWIRDKKRRNGDEDMVEQAHEFTQTQLEAVMDYTSRLRPKASDLAPIGWRNPDFPAFNRE